MMRFLFWLIGTCFLILGLFCFFASFTEWHGGRSGPKKAKSKDFLVWAGIGVVSLGLMTLFYKL